MRSFKEFVCGLLVTMCLAACEQVVRDTPHIRPDHVNLEGRWRLDSTRTTFYISGRKQWSGQVPQDKPSLLTVRAHSWTYSREEVPDWIWAYTRKGDTLLLKWAQRVDTAVITTLSANQLSYRLKPSGEGDAQDYPVSDYHYSR